MAPTEELLLIDAKDDKEYKIIVSVEDAEKARRGTNAINNNNNFDIFINENTIVIYFYRRNFCNVAIGRG